MGRKSAVTSEKLVEIHAEMTASGKGYAEVAVAHGLKPSTLYNLLKKNNLEFKVGKRGRPAKVVAA